jgi:GDPmannose 4,6-dehydratase
MTEVTGLGVLRLLEAIRQVDPTIKLVHASSSEMYGSTPPPQDERTQFHPRSPYGVAKLMAHHTVINYRESYGMHASTVIMFNHTSKRRGLEFVERKITHGVASLLMNKQRWLDLGRLDTMRDWGWAPEYMKALPLVAAMLDPGDYVLATGVMKSVEELVEVAFRHFDLDWHDYVQSDRPELKRPADVEALCGNSLKARRVLGWEPVMTFEDIVRELCEYDWELMQR